METLAHLIGQLTDCDDVRMPKEHHGIVERQPLARFELSRDAIERHADSCASARSSVISATPSASMNTGTRPARLT